MTLRDAQLEDRDRLASLLTDYLFEFDGRTEPYPDLDSYWEKPERLPFLIEIDGEDVGLCLIRRRDGGWGIADSGHPSGAEVALVGRRTRLDSRVRVGGGCVPRSQGSPEQREALAFLAVGFSEIEGPGTGVTVTRRAL